VATIQYVVNAVDAASATFERIAGSADHVLEKLDEISHKTAEARIRLEGDKEATLAIDKLDLKMAKLGQRVAQGKIGVEGQARALLDIRKLELEMDKLSAKRATVHIDIDRGLSKLAGSSFLQPSALGAAATLLPTLIPLAAEAAGAVGAIGVSFGAAAAGAGLFGVMASSVLSKVSEDAKKLSTLNMKLAAATTAAQKKAIKQQIENLTIGWAKGYMALIGNYQDFQQKWKSISQAITVPTLNVWLPVLTKGLQFLKPLIKPIADAFTLWGITLNTYFSDPVHAQRIRDLAAAFGNFSAQQLYRIGQFITDIAKGIFNLGKDLAASGANFSAFGTWLTGIGAGFLTWSKSADARRDVHGFMKFLHDEGPVVKGILQDLGKLLPGVFAGATTVGTLELQVLGDFLNMIAGLPKGWQKGLTEAVGALLLLNKLGVVKVGLKLTGWSLAGQAAGGAAEGAGATGAIAALQKSTGLKWIVRGGLIVAITELLVKPVLQQTSSGQGKNWWDNPFGTDKGKGALNSWKDLWHDIEHIFDVGRHFIAASWDRTWQDTIGKAIRFGKSVVDSVKADWHDIAHAFDVGRHAVAATWDSLWRAVSSSAKAFWAAIISSAKAFWHNIASVFDSIRHAIATTWDTIWRNTVTRVRNGIDTVVGWVKTLPGRAINALMGFGTSLYNFAHQAFTKMWNGAKAVASSIWSWLTSWVRALPGWLRHLLGIKSPSSVFYDIGRQMMMGLFHGIKDHATHAADAARHAIGNVLTGGAGPAGGDPQENMRIAASMFPWPRSQWPAFNALVMAESGYNRFARNPSSGAYGIPQALPESKLPFAGQSRGGSHAGAQLSWMFNYIAQRYGNPVNAWGHEVRYHWYGGGLQGGLFTRPTLIGVGERGPERVDITPVSNGPGSMARVELLLGQILAALRVAPAATSAGVVKSLNSAARGAVGAR
jgi:hypothetical protein